MGDKHRKNIAEGGGGSDRGYSTQGGRASSPTEGGRRALGPEEDESLKKQGRPTDPQTRGRR